MINQNKDATNMNLNALKTYPQYSLDMQIHVVPSCISPGLQLLSGTKGLSVEIICKTSFTHVYMCTNKRKSQKCTEKWLIWWEYQFCTVCPLKCLAPRWDCFHKCNTEDLKGSYRSLNMSAWTHFPLYTRVGLGSASCHQALWVLGRRILES